MSRCPPARLVHTPSPGCVAHFRPDAPAARGAASVAAAAAPPASRRSSRVPAPRKQLGSQRLRLDHALPHRPQRPRTPAATRARARARAPSARLERPRGSAVAPFTVTAAPPQRASSRGCGGGEGCHVAGARAAAAVSVSLRVGARSPAYGSDRRRSPPPLHAGRCAARGPPAIASHVLVSRRQWVTLTPHGCGARSHGCALSLPFFTSAGWTNGVFCLIKSLLLGQKEPTLP